MKYEKKQLTTTAAANTTKIPDCKSSPPAADEGAGRLANPHARRNAPQEFLSSEMRRFRGERLRVTVSTAFTLRRS
jgi:hypothetical protein